MIWVICLTLLAGAMAAPMQSLSVNDDGTYQFFYETGKDGGNHKRTEIRQLDGSVIGKFSYEDPNGEIREVSYRADDAGYTADGDVSVEGAPRGRFPVIPEHLDESESPEEVDEEPKAVAVEEEPNRDENAEQPKDDPKPEELALDAEPSPDSPPEAFPQGYFLQHFQGLRRLPEVTSEEPPTSMPPTIEKDSEETVTEPEKAPQPTAEPGASSVALGDPHKLALKTAQELFLHLRPFQSFRPSPVDSAVFHQPMYVFSYQHPDTYGYHYFF